MALTKLTQVRGSVAKELEVAILAASNLAKTKLGKTEKAADSAKLEGKSKSQVVAEARTGLASVGTSYTKLESDNLAKTKLGKTEKAADSSKLEGKSKAQVVAESRTGLAPQITTYTKAEVDALVVNSNDSNRRLHKVKLNTLLDENVFIII